MQFGFEAAEAILYEMLQLNRRLISSTQNLSTDFKSSKKLALYLPKVFWDLHAVGWDEGPWALATPVKAIMMGVGLKKCVES